MDGLVLARVQLHHHGVGVEHLHHLGRQERREREIISGWRELCLRSSAFIFGGVSEQTDGGSDGK